VQRVYPVASGANQVSDPDDVNSGLLFRVGVLDQPDLGVGAQSLDVRDLDEIVDALAVELEVEARVLEGRGQLDDGLAQLVDLLLWRSLCR
jgi:hypothetical protein